MVTKMQVFRLISEAFKINETNSRYKICVDYSKCLGEHHAEVYVIDEEMPSTECRVVMNLAVDEKYEGMTGAGAASVEEAIAEMQKWREAA